MLVYLGERASFVLVGAAILFPSRLSAKKRRYSKFHKMSIALANPREVARQRRQGGGEEKNLRGQYKSRVVIEASGADFLTKSYGAAAVLQREAFFARKARCRTLVLVWTLRQVLFSRIFLLFLGFV